MKVLYLPAVDSTNRWAKAHLAEFDAVGAVWTMSQTAGRGRLGRSFVSPRGDGLYMSILLHPDLPLDKIPLLMLTSAVAVCEALEHQCGVWPKIKWVNDILYMGKKLCGILVETGTSSGFIDYAVVGVGLNLFYPKDGFPPELSNTAAALFEGFDCEKRDKALFSLADSLIDWLEPLDPERILPEYIKRSVLIGRRITVHRPGGSVPAHAVGIDKRARLEVLYDDGQREALDSGEVSVRLG